MKVKKFVDEKFHNVISIGDCKTFRITNYFQVIFDSTTKCTCLLIHMKYYKINLQWLWQLAFNQKNIKASRKQILPFIDKFVNNF